MFSFFLLVLQCRLSFMPNHHRFEQSEKNVNRFEFKMERWRRFLIFNFFVMYFFLLEYFHLSLTLLVFYKVHYHRKVHHCQQLYHTTKTPNNVLTLPYMKNVIYIVRLYKCISLSIWQDDDLPDSSGVWYTICPLLVL